MHPKLAGFSHVSLSCRDVDVSIRFYCELLGFKPLTTVETLEPGVTEIILLHEDSGAIVGLQPTRTGADAPPQREVPGLHHLGFRVRERDGLDQWRAHLSAHGSEVTAVEDHHDEYGRGATLYTTDPDGTSIEFYYSSEHPEPRAQATGR